MNESTEGTPEMERESERGNLLREEDDKEEITVHLLEDQPQPDELELPHPLILMGQLMEMQTLMGNGIRQLDTEVRELREELRQTKDSLSNCKKELCLLKKQVQKEDTKGNPQRLSSGYIVLLTMTVIGGGLLLALLKRK